MRKKQTRPILLGVLILATLVVMILRGKLNREGKQESRGKRPQTLPSAFLFFRPQPAAGAGREAYSFTVNTTVSSPSMRALMLPL